MLIVVKDACLLIDLAESDLLEIWCRLGIPTHITDLVLAEVTHSKQKKQISTLIEQGALQKHSLDEAALEKAINLFQRDGISLPDASAVILASQLNACLLTGDRKLRRTAEQHLINTHGMLWVLDYMIEKGMLPPEKSAACLTSLRGRGSRYPQHECEERIKKWKNAASPKEPCDHA